MDKKNVPKALTLGFIVAECAVYAAFLTLELCGYTIFSERLKYVGVLFCLFFCLLCYLYGASPLMPSALLLTASADYFLLVLEQQYILGVSLFLGVQLLYLLYMWRLGAGVALWLRLPLAAFFLGVVWFAGLFTPLTILAAVYFSQLLSCAVLAWIRLKKTGLLPALGFSLFVCCDICVGLHNLAAHIPQALGDAATFSMWLFYLPSQVLLSLSALSEKELTRS